MEKLTTKQRILTTATKFFLEFGYAGTVIEELAKEAKVSKGAVFYHYKNKETLAIAAINEYYEDLQDKLRKFEINPDPLKTVDNYLNNFVAQLISDSGVADKSLLGSMSLEVADKLPDLKAELAKKYEHWIQAIKRLLDRIFTKGDIVDTYSLARQLISTLEGGMILYHSGATKANALLMNIKSFQHYLSLLASKKA